MEDTSWSVFCCWGVSYSTVQYSTVVLYKYVPRYVPYVWLLCVGGLWIVDWGLWSGEESGEWRGRAGQVTTYGVVWPGVGWGNVCYVTYTVLMLSDMYATGTRWLGLDSMVEIEVGRFLHLERGKGKGQWQVPLR